MPTHGDEFELTLMQREYGSLQFLQPALKKFEEIAHKLPLNLVMYDWVQGRSELIRAALYHHGADVSEVGTTWISDLIAMNALRPFTQAEVDLIGSAGAFLPAAWRTAHFSDEPTIWSIPWLSETFTLHYRKDLLEKAGIEERTAFASPEQLTATARRLREAGYELPIALPPLESRTMFLHVAASWVWQAGGEFMSPDSQSVSFNDPAALQGLSHFFNLFKTISKNGLKRLNADGILNCFMRGDAPMAVGGLWLSPRNMAEGTFDVSQWGVTRLPGPPFVGGTNLVLWKHTRHDREAVNLIRLLMSEDTASSYAYAIGMLPTRTRALSMPPFSEDRFTRVAFESMQQGRSYPNFPLWGLVEERLSNGLTQVAQAMLSDPQADPGEVLARVLNPLARSLNITLSQR